MAGRRAPSAHGTHTKYSKGCRCDECRLAHRAYGRHQARLIRREKQGIEARPIKFVDPNEAREHLIFLRSRGIGLKSIAKQTGMNRANLQRLAKGQKIKIHVDYANRILAIPAIHILDGAYVQSDEAKRLIRELRDNGYFVREIADALGQKGANITLGHKIRLSRLRKIQKVHAQLIRRRPR